MTIIDLSFEHKQDPNIRAELILEDDSIRDAIDPTDEPHNRPLGLIIAQYNGIYYYFVTVNQYRSTSQSLYNRFIQMTHFRNDTEEVGNNVLLMEDLDSVYDENSRARVEARRGQANQAVNQTEILLPELRQVIGGYIP